MPDPTSKVTPKNAAEWRPTFLLTLRNTGNVRASCQAAGISRKTAYTAKLNAPEFTAQWTEAMADAIDILEAIAVKRAKETSDVLLIFLLKSHRPEIYRETIAVRLEIERIIKEATEDTRALALERGYDPDAAVAELEPYVKLLTSGRSNRGG